MDRDSQPLVGVQRSTMKVAMRRVAGVVVAVAAEAVGNTIVVVVAIVPASSVVLSLVVEQPKTRRHMVELLARKYWVRVPADCSRCRKQWLLLVDRMTEDIGLVVVVELLVPGDNNRPSTVVDRHCGLLPLQVVVARRDDDDEEEEEDACENRDNTARPPAWEGVEEHEPWREVHVTIGLVWRPTPVVVVVFEQWRMDGPLSWSRRMEKEPWSSSEWWLWSCSWWWRTFQVAGGLW